jgi:hypothetical protein
MKWRMIEMTKWRCNECTPSCVLVSDNTIPPDCPYRYDDFEWKKVAAKSSSESAKKSKRSPVKKVENPVKKYLFV